MAKFRKVHTSFWDDTFIEKLSAEDRYFYLFLLTNPMATECGIYQMSIRKMSYYTGYNNDAVLTIINRFIEQGKVKYSQENSEIIILNRAKYIDNYGKPTLDCLKSELKQVKTPEFVVLFMSELPEAVQKSLDIDIQHSYEEQDTPRPRPVHAPSTPRGEERDRERDREREYPMGEKSENLQKPNEHEKMPLQVMEEIWLRNFPEYKLLWSKDVDYPALRKIGEAIWKKVPSLVPSETIKSDFQRFCDELKETWYTDKTLKVISNNYQSIRKEIEVKKNQPKKDAANQKIVLPAAGSSSFPESKNVKIVLK